MDAGAARGRVLEMWEPWADSLLPGRIECYRLAQSDGSARNRKNIRAADALLSQAGWTVQNGLRRNAEVLPF